MICSALQSYKAGNETADSRTDKLIEKFEWVCKIVVGDIQTRKIELSETINYYV